MVTVAVLAVLATMFALGYASGCSAYKTDDEVKTSEPVVTAETVTPPAPGTEPRGALCTTRGNHGARPPS